jgi:hypothetical protein
VQGEHACNRYCKSYAVGLSLGKIADDPAIYVSALQSRARQGAMPFFETQMQTSQAFSRVGVAFQ